MPAASLSSLEALGDQFALNAATERKRMLVIVNPYATTVSDRLRNLVVYALQGRYEVDAVDTKARDHATELTREAAGEGYDVVVAFGGDGTVNEAANGLRGSTTPLTCLPGGSTNVYARMLGIPNDIVDATEHLLRIADDWQPREVRMAQVNERRFLFSSGLGLDAAVVARVDAHPHLKARFGPYYFAYCGFGEFLGKYVAKPPRLETVTDGGAPLPGVTVLVQKGDPYTYFRKHPDPRRPRRDAGRPDAGRHRAAQHAPDGHAGGPLPPLLRARRAGAPPPGRRLRRRRARSSCARSTAARCRCTSTATTSAT